MSTPRQQKSRHILTHGVGQSTVELAAVLAILLPILVGAVDLGRAYFAYDILVHAVNEGVRRGSFDTDAANVVATVRAAGGPLDLPSGDIIVTCFSGATTTTKACGSMVLGDSVRVAATASFTPITPLIAALIPGGSLTLRAVTQRTFQ